MFPQERSTKAKVDLETYPLVENREPTSQPNELAIVVLSHTQLEQRLYAAMLASGLGHSFTARRLMDLTGIRSLSSVRRGLDGLLVKLSIDRNRSGRFRRDQANQYRVYPPNEIIARRKERGAFTGYPTESEHNGKNESFNRAITRVAENPMLSRREAQVALFCVQGLTNAAIGERLKVSEQTVKFHLRHIFVKFGVKRRAELISKLLM
jgi:DNA-binding CsgD family transcriptional regulator